MALVSKARPGARKIPATKLRIVSVRMELDFFLAKTHCLLRYQQIWIQMSHQSEIILTMPEDRPQIIREVDYDEPHTECQICEVRLIYYIYSSLIKKICL